MYKYKYKYKYKYLDKHYLIDAKEVAVQEKDVAKIQQGKMVSLTNVSITQTRLFVNFNMEGVGAVYSFTGYPTFAGGSRILTLPQNISDVDIYMQSRHSVSDPWQDGRTNCVRKNVEKFPAKFYMSGVIRTPSETCYTCPTPWYSPTNCP
jgi:hypothetical protein